MAWHDLSQRLRFLSERGSYSQANCGPRGCRAAGALGACVDRGPAGANDCGLGEGAGGAMIPETMECLDGIIVDWNNNPLCGGDGIIWNGRPVGPEWGIIDVLLSVSRHIQCRLYWAGMGHIQYFLGVARDLEGPLYKAYAFWQHGMPIRDGQNMRVRVTYDLVRAQGAISFGCGAFSVVPLSILDREIILAPLNGMHKTAPWSTAYIGRLGKDGSTPEKGT